MAPKTPEDTMKRFEEIALEVQRGVTEPAVPPQLPAPLLKTLQERGYRLPEIRRRAIPYFWKVSWEDLCTLRTQDPKVMASPLMVVVNVTAMPDAPQEFKDYQGMIRAEFFIEDGTACAVTHAYSYAETGELTPLTEWLQQEPPPFYARIGYIETRKEGRHVVRPLPLDIEIR